MQFGCNAKKIDGTVTLRAHPENPHPHRSGSSGAGTFKTTILVANPIRVTVTRSPRQLTAHLNRRLNLLGPYAPLKSKKFRRIETGRCSPCPAAPNPCAAHPRGWCRLPSRNAHSKLRLRVDRPLPPLVTRAPSRRGIVFCVLLLYVCNIISFHFAMTFARLYMCFFPFFPRSEKFKIKLLNPNNGDFNFFFLNKNNFCIFNFFTYWMCIGVIFEMIFGDFFCVYLRSVYRICIFFYNIRNASTGHLLYFSLLTCLIRAFFILINRNVSKGAM